MHSSSCLLSCLLLTACFGDPRPDSVPTFTLTKTRSIAGELPVAGIDTDRAGGVWIAYRELIGGYEEPDDVRVVHLDAAGAKVSEWHYFDQDSGVSGLAYTGDAVWLAYNGAVGPTALRKIDPASGKIIGGFTVEAGIVDLSSTTAGTLLLSKMHNELVTVDASNGSEMVRADVSVFSYSTQRGIAADGDMVWVASTESRDIDLVASDGQLLARGVNEILADTNTSPSHLAWDGQHLLVNANNQIVWLAVQP